jgi:hypothetical protein
MDGEEVPIALSAESHMQPKHLVSMGAYVCIWPDKVYFNSANLADHGSMGMKWTPEADAVVSAMMCRKDGTNYDMESITISDTAPAEPEDQQLWLDTSGENDVLKQYSEAIGLWMTIPTVYTRLRASGIGNAFAKHDGLTVTGFTQQQLSLASGVALRMVQLYEQKQNDLSKAQVNVVISLAKALGCEVEDLID